MKYIEEFGRQEKPVQVKHWRKYYLHYSVAVLGVIFVVVFAVLIPWVRKNCQVAAEDGSTSAEARLTTNELPIGDDTIFPNDSVDSVLASLYQTTQDPTFDLDNIILDEINHRLFIAEETNNRVLVYDLDENNHEKGLLPNLILGQRDLSTNNSATNQSGFNAPVALANDPANHRLFVADSGNNRVLVFDTTNLIINQPASHVLGQKDFTSSEVTEALDSLNNPGELTFDSAQNQLAVRDRGNRRLVIFDVKEIADGQPSLNTRPLKPEVMVAPLPSAE